jgi:AcrR family transcriptional regulator
MKPRNTDSPKYRQHKLEAIRAAAAVFAEKGFHGATTNDIANRLGIKQGSLYYYFDSKEEALEDVCLYGFEQYAESMDEIARSAEPFEAQILAVVTNHLGRYREKSEALKVHNDERLYLPPARRHRLKELGSRYREQLAVIGMCNGLGELIVRDPDADVFALARKCTDLLLQGTAPKTINKG